MRIDAPRDAVIFAAAQSHSKAGDIAANLKRHLHFMKLAAEQGADFLMFPELSLTGYEPALARELAIVASDPRLELVKAIARKLGMITVMGAPIQSATPGEVLIGALIFGADGTLQVYTKQYLHSGEEQVFSPGEGGAAIDMGGKRIGLAVCADFSHADHARNAAEAGATVYAASVLISGKGYAHDAERLREHARRHRMAVLAANHAGTTGGRAAAARCGMRRALWWWIFPMHKKAC